MIRSSDNNPKKGTIVKIADESKASNTTLAADLDLQFPVKNGRFYFIELFVSIFTVSSTPQFKYSLDGPVSTQARAIHRVATNGTSILVDAWDVSGTSGWPTNTSLPIAVLGALKVELTYAPQADGTFSLKWAQGTSSSSATIVLGGSLLRYVEAG